MQLENFIKENKKILEELNEEEKINYIKTLHKQDGEVFSKEEILKKLNSVLAKEGDDSKKKTNKIMKGFGFKKILYAIEAIILLFFIYVFYSYYVNNNVIIETKTNIKPKSEKETTIKPRTKLDYTMKQASDIIKDAIKKGFKFYKCENNEYKVELKEKMLFMKDKKGHYVFSTTVSGAKARCNTNFLFNIYKK